MDRSIKGVAIFINRMAKMCIRDREGEEPVGYAVLELYSTHNRRILRQRMICSIED